MDETLNIEKFSPAKAEVLKAVAIAEKTDLTNIAQVHENRIALRTLRVDITKHGKELRESALKFQKDVIAKEKELVAIIEPAEAVLEKVEAEHKLKIEMEKRRKELPSRVEAILAIGDQIPFDENDLLKMDDNEFNAYRLLRIDQKLEADRRAHEAKVKKDEDEARAKRDAEDKARRERIEADEKALAEKKAAADAEIAAKKAAADKEAAEKKAAADKEAAEKKAALDAEKARLDGIEAERQRAAKAAEEETARKEREAKLEADRKEAARKEAEAKELATKREAAYKEWLASIGFDASKGDMIKVEEGEHIAYRVIGRYKLSK